MVARQGPVCRGFCERRHLRNDADVNAELYGRKIDNKEVLSGATEPPAAAQALRAALDKYSMRK
jgi:lipid-binding SYLF domain-containing protein